MKNIVILTINNKQSEIIEYTPNIYNLNSYKI